MVKSSKLLVLIGLLLSSFLTVVPFQGQAQTCGQIFDRTARVTTVRAFAKIPSLRVMTFNVKNLFLHVGKFEPSDDLSLRRVSEPADKPQDELIGIQRAIDETSPDILILQEVEGIGALREFASRFLGGKYRAFLSEGNDSRGIDIGFLIKTDLPLAIEMHAHKDMTWRDPVAGGREVPLFSRDVPALLFKRDKNDSRPVLILLGNHGKSKRDRHGDPESTLLRTAQYEGIARIIEQYQKKYGRNVPLLLAGDFNTDVSQAPEVESVRRKLHDSFDLKGVQPKDRITHTYHPSGRPVVQSQLDSVMVSDVLAQAIESARVYRYRDERGRLKPVPQTYEEREQNPSDHFPVVVDLSTELIFPEAHRLPKASGQ